MTVIANPFDRPEFQMAELTKSINLLPNMYGRVGKMGLFKGRGITTRSIIIEFNNGKIRLLTSKPLGSDGSKKENSKRIQRTLTIPHYPHDGEILPHEYQGIREFGSTDELKSLTRVMNDKLQALKNDHLITLEFLRAGAYKGIILDGDGSVMYDLFDEFGVAQKTIDFALDNSATDVLGKCRELLRYQEDNLLGDTSSGKGHALVSEEFFEAFVNHDKVKAAYDRWNNGEFFRTDQRNGFEFGNIVWEEYRGRAPDESGNQRRFINAGEGHVVPLGTMNAFDEVYAPGDFTETANTIGEHIYVRQEARKFNRGIDLHSQSNPLPYCATPGVLVKVTA